MYISSTNSTNTLLKELIAKGEWPEDERYLYAGYQTAGRGQTGNGWESEEGKNLLCSVLMSYQPSAISRQPFYLNVLVSVAVHNVIRSLLLERSGLRSLSEAVSIKWPNDIYWGDKKVAGILIENSIIGGEVRYSIAGIGLNVNQTKFVSDAPNPVSLKQITDKTYDLDKLMECLMEEMDRVQNEPQEEIWHYYCSHLYRREGFWPFVEREVSTEPTRDVRRDEGQRTKEFMARIADILPTGEIVLQDEQGKQRIYHFKQIRYVI